MAKAAFWNIEAKAQGQIVLVHNPQSPGSEEGTHPAYSLLLLVQDQSDGTWELRARRRAIDKWATIKRGTGSIPTVEQAVELRRLWHQSNGKHKG